MAGLVNLLSNVFQQSPRVNVSSPVVTQSNNSNPRSEERRVGKEC